MIPKPSEPLSVVPLRGVFAPEDAWVVTGDLFKRDADGDYWRVSGVTEVIQTRGGPVFPGPVRVASRTSGRSSSSTVHMRYCKWRANQSIQRPYRSAVRTGSLGKWPSTGYTTRSTGLPRSRSAW